MSPAPPNEVLIIFFDGVCSLCNSYIDFLIRHDSARRLRYAPLQGTTFAAIRARHTAETLADSIIVLETVEGQEVLRQRSDAFCAIMERLPAPWRLLRWIQIIPRPLRDLGYRFVARIRYRVFGKRATCRLPTPAERALFLD
jgi:predicted DCC family thiol-disulfide oxidoreductase YuxK